MNVLPAPILGVSAPPGAVVGVRPHDIVIDNEGPLRATVDLVEPRGHDAVVHLTLQGDAPGEILAVVRASQAPSVGESVSVSVGQDTMHVFDRASGARIKANSE